MKKIGFIAIIFALFMMFVACGVDSEKKAPEGYSDFGLESTTSEFNYDAYIDNEFFCLDKEGNWSEISRRKLAEFIPHFNNGAALGPLEGFKVSFASACKAVFARKDAE